MLSRHWPLAVIIVAYIIIGSLFSTRVPAWQNPDEPAHWNYTRQFVQTGRLPVIEPADWNIKLVPIGPDQRNVPVEQLTYEDHQPPLFYIVTSPAYALFGGRLAPMRLASLLLGALTIVFAYLTVATIFPAHLYLAAFAAAFVGLLPQHLFIMSGYNNDSLSEALLALGLWLSVRVIRDEEIIPRGEVIALGIVVGLCFWTKAQAYLALPVAAFALWRTCWNAPDATRNALRRLLTLIIVACVIGLPWWIHNIQMYGGADFLGLQRHNAVVAGQPTTAEWILQYGFGGLMARLLQTTFQSYWGQFGWMSVLLDSKIYWLMLVLTLTSAALFVAWWAHGRSAKRRLQGQTQTKTGASIHSPFLVLTETQSRRLTLLAVLMGLTVLAFIWYNLQFVQHQGRYLFPALIPIATAFALGWSFIFSRRENLVRWLWLVVLIGLFALDGYVLLRVILPAMQA
jgi:4-amino-4-deoxy-L-arabinose transferase-like glycosyltransferase